MNRDQDILKSFNQSHHHDSQPENLNPETDKSSSPSKKCESFPSCLFQSSSRSLESSDCEEEEDTKSTSSTRSPSDQGIFSSSADISSTDSSDEVNSSSSTSSVSHDGLLFSRNKQMSSSSPSICHSLHLLSSHRRSVLSNNIIKTRKTNRPGSWTGSNTNLKIMDIASDDEEEDLHIYDFGTSSRVESDEEDDVSHRFQAEEEEEDYHDKTKYTEKERKVMQVQSAEPDEDYVEISAESVLTKRKSVGKKSLASESFISMQSPLDHLQHQVNHQQEQQESNGLMISCRKNNMNVNHYSSPSPSEAITTSDSGTVDSCLLNNYYCSYISNKHSNEVLINGKPVDMTSEQYAVLTFDQVVRLDQVMDSRMQIHGRGNFPTLEVKLKDLVQVVKNKLTADGVSVRDIRLNGGAASHVLMSSRDVKQHTYTDLDLIFGVELCNHKTFDKVRTAVLDSLVDFLPEGVNRKKMSTCTLKEAYVHKMVKVIEGGDKWSLISLCNNTGRDIEIKFVDTMKRQFEFSVDSFQIILDSLLLFYECQSRSDSRARIMTENIYPTVVGESVYGNFSEAMTHLQRRIIATRNPEQIRGGGLLKYCRLRVLGYKPVKYDEIKSMEKYMCSRFFIDFSDITVQRMKLANYLNTHFHDDQVKYDYLMILQKVVDESTVCLMGHERRQTLSLIDEFASYFYFPVDSYQQQQQHHQTFNSHYSSMSNVHHHEKQQQQQKTVSSGSHPINEPVSYSSHPNNNLNQHLPGSSSPSVSTTSSSQANNIQQNSLQFSGLNSTPMSYNPFSAHHQQQQNNSNLIRDHHLNNVSLSSSSLPSHAKNQFVPSIEVNSSCSSSSIVSYSSHCNHHHHHHHLSQQQLQQQSKSFQGQVLSTVSPSSPHVGCSHSTVSSQHPPQTQTLVIGADGHFYLTPTYPSSSTPSSDETTTTVQSAYHAHHHHHHPCPHHQHMTHTFGCYNNCNCGGHCQSLWMPVA